MGTLSETAVSRASKLIPRRDDQAIDLYAGLTTDFLDRSHRPLFLMRPILESPRATLHKSRDGARAVSGWGARHHLRWPQTWRGHSGDVQRREPSETGMRDVRGIVQRSPNQTAPTPACNAQCTADFSAAAQCQSARRTEPPAFPRIIGWRKKRNCFQAVHKGRYQRCGGARIICGEHRQ